MTDSLIRRRLTAAIYVGAIALGGVALPAAAADMTPALKDLAAAANKEGKLNVSWGASSLGGPTGARIMQDAMNKAYGTNITITWSPGPSMPNMGNQIAMRQSNGLASPTDVYLGFSRNYATLKKHNLFLSAPWKSYSPDRLTDAVVEQNGTLVKVISATLGFTYNTRLAPSAPKKITDFLKPEWKGKVATTPYGAGFDQLAGENVWGAERTLDFAKKFTSQVGGFLRCSDSERLSSGEFLALVFDCSGDSMQQAARKGAPLKRVIALDAPIVSYFYLAVPKNSGSPDAAKLYITFALSRDGQKIIWQEAASDLHLLPGSEVAKEIAEVEREAGVKFVNSDVDWQLKNQKGNAAQREATKLMRQAGKKK